MTRGRFWKMDNYVDRTEGPTDIDPECFESVRDAMLRSTDGYTTFDGQFFGAPKPEAYKPPEIDLRSPQLIKSVAAFAVNEAMVA